jgi:fibronectin type 3 domain-containing protein
VNDAGEGQGAVVSAVPFTVPGTVKNLRVVSSLIFITISWEPGDNGGSNITAYRIYRYADGEDEKLIAELASNETTYIDMNVTGGKTYHYRVSAVNEAGEGEKSAEVSAVVDTGEGIVTACLLGMIASVVAVIIVVVLLVYLLLRKKKAPQKPEENKEKKV